MIIPYLNSTNCGHGVFTIRLQMCASNLVADVSQPTHHHDQRQYRYRRLPTVIDCTVFPVRSTTSASGKVHSIPIHPPR
jgi:hypothetical protein